MIKMLFLAMGIGCMAMAPDPLPATTTGTTLSVLKVKRDTVPANPSYTYRIIPVGNNTYGYEIFNGNKKVIRQDCIPTVPGNKGFATKEDAGKVAALVIKKLQQNIFPPAVTREELKQLKVL